MSIRKENAGDGRGPRGMRRPQALAVAADSILVADAGNPRDSRRWLDGVAACGSATAAADPCANPAPLLGAAP